MMAGWLSMYGHWYTKGLCHISHMHTCTHTHTNTLYQQNEAVTHSSSLASTWEECIPPARCSLTENTLVPNEAYCGICPERRYCITKNSLSCTHRSHTTFIPSHNNPSSALFLLAALPCGSCLYTPLGSGAQKAWVMITVEFFTIIAIVSQCLLTCVEHCTRAPCSQGECPLTSWQYILLYQKTGREASFGRKRI